MVDSRLVNQLIDLNFTPSEAKTYVALLEIGQTSAGEIIKRTELHRSVVYESLEKLINKKLVFQLTKQNIAHFQPTDPERILRQIKHQEETALDLLPKLKKLVDTKQSEITIYEGIEAYRNFWIDSLRRQPVGSIDYVAGSIGQPWSEFLGPAVEQYFKIAQQRKISWKLVVFDLDDAEHTFLSKYPDFKWEYRLIDREVPKEGNFNVLGDDTLILHSATEPMVIEVKNQSLVKVFRNLFDILWESGKEIKK